MGGEEKTENDFSENDFSEENDSQKEKEMDKRKNSQEESIVFPAKKNKTGTKVMSEEQIQELLKPGKEFESKLNTVLEGMKEGTANLIVVSVKEYPIASKTIICYFNQKQIPGVYVTTNKPYRDLIKIPQTNPVTIHYIDVITFLAGKETIEEPNVTYLDSPLALVEIDVFIQEELQKIASSKKFLCMDSLSTLLVYNSPQSVEKFTHSVISKNRQEKTIIVLIMAESEENERVIDTLGQFVDQTTHIH